MWSQIALFCIALFMLGFIIYILFVMRKLSQTIKDMRVVTPEKKYTIDTYKRLLQSAIRIIRAKISVVTQPGFYGKSVNEMVCILPEYKVVLQYAQYTANNNVSQDTFETIMKETYGEDYAKSPELTKQVTVQHTFYERSYEHSVLIDIEKVNVIYRQQKSAVDSLLSATTQEEKVAGKYKC